MPIVQFFTKPYMLLLSENPLRKHKGFIKNEKHFKTENGEPPGVISSPPTIGNYCFRVTTSLENSDSKMREYVGYDDNIGIVEKVENMCSKDEQRFCDTKCAKSRLAFVQDVPNCDGHVDIKDFKNGTTYQSY